MLELSARLQALLFAAAEPVPVAALAAASGAAVAEVRTSLDDLASRLATDGALQLAWQGEACALVTTPAVAGDIARLLGQTARADLSRAALETLAIIAYRGPLSLGEIDAIRGVGSETMLRNLLARDLIAASDHPDQAGRTKRYIATAALVHLLGLTSLAELPPLPATTPVEHAA